MKYLDPMPTIIVDTREQWPYTFSEMPFGKNLTIETVRGTLTTGDYSLTGFENAIAIERKSVKDFYQSITGQRARFEREVRRLSEITVKAIVVEGRFSDVMLPLFYGSHLPPGTISGTVASWYVRYGVPFWFLVERFEAERFTFKLLFQFWKNFSEGRITL